MRSTRVALLIALASFATSSVLAETNFVRINPIGYRMISNPLNSTNNDVSNLFKNPPPFLTIFKPSSTATDYDVATFDPDIPGWSSKMELLPGEGAWMYNPGPTKYTNTFFGEIILCSTNHIPSGFSLRSQVLPRNNFVNYPIGPGDAFYFWNDPGYVYIIYDPDLLDWVPSPPSPQVGEAFWVYNNGHAKNWIICVSNP